MELIERQDLAAFGKYLDETENTICGRNPIRVLLSIIAHSKLKLQTKFVQYDQSEAVKSKQQSSVSYAASITYMI
jgi:MEMO1 family protein